ncbi:MAG TPA: hypothetical protein VK522_00505 [Pseudolabrys sp.]|nr:hypothetical protein [Pseudolabrys sp.]
MLRTPFIETLSDLFSRSAQWRGRDELFVDDADRITGAEALDSALRISQGFADHGAGPGELIGYLCRSSARHRRRDRKTVFADTRCLIIESADIYCARKRLMPQLSSPGLTGRPSIPEPPVIEP